MLYHPCAHPSEVNKLKSIVKNCVGKHIITPSNLVPPERVSQLLCNIILPRLHVVHLIISLWNM